MQPAGLERWIGAGLAGATGASGAAALDIALTPGAPPGAAVQELLLLTAIGIPVGCGLAARAAFAASAERARVHAVWLAVSVATFFGFVTLGLGFRLFQLADRAALSWVPGAVLAAVVLATVVSGRACLALRPRIAEGWRPYRWLALAFGSVPAAGLVAAAFVAAAAPSHPGPSGSPAVAPPGSVVLIVLDTTRADALGPWGGVSGATPVLDRLAAEGAIIERLFSPSPWTVPAHASLFTGLPPAEHGAHNGPEVPWLGDGFVTLAERFATGGGTAAAFYANGWFGVGNLLQGFSVHEYVGAPGGGLIAPGVVRHLGVGPSAWTDAGGHALVERLDRWLSGRDPARPFFLFINLMEVHTLLLPPQSARPGGPVERARHLLRVRHHDNDAWHWGPPRRRETIDAVRAHYHRAVAYQDRVLGRIVARLESRIALDSVSLVVTADHGENLGEGGRWGHMHDLGPRLLHVPGVIRAPDRFGAGTRIPGDFSLTDLHDLVLELAELAPAGSGALPGAPRDATHAVFHADPRATVVEFARPGWQRSAMSSSVRSVRRGAFQLEAWDTGRVELFDLEADPDRLEDRSDRHPAVRASLLEMQERLRRAQARRATPDSQGERPPLDPEMRKQLEALGYL